MTLVQLRHLISLAQSGSFTRSAEALFLTQPALSRSIRALEEELGQKLFQRLGRKAVLTESGDTLLERARRIVSEVDQTINELKTTPALGPKIVVGAIPTVAPFLRQ